MAEAAAAREVEARAAVEFELQEARASLDAALAEDARLGAQLETGAAEKGKLLAALSAAQSEFQTANEQRDAIASQLKASTARVQSLEERSSTTRPSSNCKPSSTPLDSKSAFATNPRAAIRRARRAGGERACCA